MTADPQDRPAEPPTGPPPLPAGRYGPPRRPMPKALPFLLLALAVLAVVPLTVAVYDRLNPPVRADVLGWDIAAQEVTVRVQIEKPTEAEAVCTLQARDRGDEIVGSRIVRVADAEDLVRIEETFPTAREAVTVTASKCHEAGDDDPAATPSP